MVGEARFGWDDSLSLELPDRRDRFDHLDDEFLEVFTSDKTPDPKPSGPEPKKRRLTPDGKPRRHLAGADWLRDEPKPPQRS